MAAQGAAGQAAGVATVARNLLASYYRRRRPVSLDSVRRIEVASELKLIERGVEAARVRVEAVRARFATGTSSALELKRAEVELLEREADLARLRLELSKIRK